MCEDASGIAVFCHHGTSQGRSMGYPWRRARHAANFFSTTVALLLPNPNEFTRATRILRS